VKPHVLLVDDEPGFRDLLSYELGRASLSVCTAASAEEALEHIEQMVFDVVVTDLRLPGMSGIELLQQVHRRSPDTEAVIMTGFASVETAIAGLRARAFDYVLKPFEINNLIDIVLRAVEHRRKRAATGLIPATQAVFQTHDPRRLPQLIVDVAMSVMEADDASILVPQGSSHLEIAYSHAYKQGQDPVALDGSIAGRVAQRRIPELLGEHSIDDARYSGVERHGRVESSIVYPLVSGERLCGVLCLNRLDRDKPFVKVDLERAAVLASQAVLALDNARLVGELHDRIQELQRARAELASGERLRAMGELAASVAHEINNPVSYVLSNTSFLQEFLDELEQSQAGESEAKLPDQLLMDVRQATLDIGEGALRIRDISADLGRLSRSRNDALMDLNQAVHSAIRLSRGKIRSRMELNLQPELLVTGNSGRLSQVFINLLINAEQAMNSRGTIWIETTHGNDTAVARVRDDGPGIAEELLPRLFDPFFSTKAPGDGTGLGLSICRDIVQDHGGTIEVEQSSPDGTTFRLTLPSG
jgi:signal transduction histidine kinase/DNA-binding response OmpR family regulator